jgi:hypothetical protein
MDSRRTPMKRIRDRLSVSKRNGPFSPGEGTPPSPGDAQRDPIHGESDAMDFNKRGHSRSPSFFDRVLRGVHPVSTYNPSYRVDGHSSQSPDNRDTGVPEFRLVASSEIINPPSIVLDVAANHPLQTALDLLTMSPDGVALSFSTSMPPLTDEHDRLSTHGGAQDSSLQQVSNRPRAQNFKQIAYNTLKLSLTLLEKVSESFPIPGVKGALGGINLMIDRFDVRFKYAAKPFVDNTFMVES